MATFVELVEHGNRLMGQRRHVEAAAYYRQALQLEPSHAGLHNNLGVALRALGQLKDAESCYQRALELDTDNLHALDNLSVVLREQHCLPDAESICRRALRIAPDHAGIRNTLGLILGDLGRLPEAIASFREAIRLNPERANVYNNLGVALRQTGDAAQSAVCFRRSLAVDPRYVNAHINLGTLLKDAGKLDEAATCYRQALAIDASNADALTNLANVTKDQGQLEEAAGLFRQALQSNPSHVEARNNLGSVLMDVGDRAGAEACFAQALRLQPDHASARWNRAVLELLQGRLPEAWADYEFRWQATGAKPRYVDHPRWDGSPLAGKTILLYAEQGLGDTIQFVRYAPLVAERAGRVVLECQPALRQLLVGVEGVWQVIAAGETPPSFDVQAPLLSLPGIFNTTLQTVPARVPYLQADAKLLEYWREELASLRGLKVGIAWQGSPTHKGDRYRSLPLANFERLASLDGIRLISLQKGAGAEQLRSALSGRVVDFGERLDAAGPFLDTAAIIRQLDLVITVDSAVAHLAGALGAPVRLLLSAAPDWRWLLDRTDSPWYPTMRLFRQTRLGNWDDVFAQVLAALRSKTDNAS